MSTFVADVLTFPRNEKRSPVALCAIQNSDGSTSRREEIATGQRWCGS
jgi:hypothetical protein